MTRSDVDESHQQLVERKKPDTKESIPYDSIYIKGHNRANISVLFKVRLVANFEEGGRGTRGRGFLGASDTLWDLGSAYTGISILWKWSEVYVPHLCILVMYVAFQLQIKMGLLERLEKNLPLAFLLFVSGEFRFDVFEAVQVGCFRRIIRKYMLQGEASS